MSNTENKSLGKIVNDLTRPLKNHKGFIFWIIFLALVIINGLVAYYGQLKIGLGTTALSDYVSWGLYISSFIFFVATALVGMLISSVLGLLGIKWITPIARIAEMVAIGFVMLAGIVIILDMGRPERLLNVFVHARIQSPIFWDATVVTFYVIISLLLFLLPLIPDIPFLKKTMTDQPKWKQLIYKMLSFGWVGSEEQYKIVKRSMRILAILIIPVALGIHTVTSWLFAMTPRIGWDSTIFGPYYVSGAFVAGSAAVVILMYVIRNTYKIKDYITEMHFDKMAKLLVLVMLVYVYFNINEYIVPAYKMKSGDDAHIFALFAGHFALMFWLVQIGGLLLPTVLFLFKPFRKPLPAMLISIAVVIGAFFKRYIITVPTLVHSNFPADNVPASYTEYWPTFSEWSITFMAIALALLIVTILAKLFPIMPIWEVAHDNGISNHEMNLFIENKQEDNEEVEIP